MAQINAWEWGRRGVDLHDDHLTWFESEGDIRFASGAACDQTLDDFVERGRWVDDVPADVLTEVTEAVRALIAAPGR